MTIDWKMFPRSDSTDPMGRTRSSRGNEDRQANGIPLPPHADIGKADILCVCTIYVNHLCAHSTDLLLLKNVSSEIIIIYFGNKSIKISILFLFLHQVSYNSLQ